MQNRKMNRLTVAHFMTLVPQTIGADIEVARARRMMRDKQIRHLPVQRAGKLVGVISDRDVKVAESFTGPGKLMVEDIMTSDPYVVLPATSLEEVALQMAQHKWGSAVIQDEDGKILGIFTDTDALRALAEQLQENNRDSAAA